ncbi:hypothetical protein CRG98_012215 [Punica granatum]|uniref:Uncharacterized protein n=1 Tax=Punica granatum TaxID=22663 RepID=A0A2I0KFX9_PUNGR|nr:hypothetical protein CRG98_012215 [Punica granatum]
MEFALNIEKSRRSVEFCSGGHFIRNSTNVARKFKPIGVRIYLLNDLHRTNLSSSELVVVTSRKSILRKDSANKIANFKLHVPSPSVPTCQVFCRIILPWEERIRPRIVIVRAITCVRNLVFNVKHIGSTNVAGKFKPIGVRIYLLNDLHRTNLSSSELVVVTSRKSILRKDSPNKIANFKLYVPSPSNNAFDTN